MPWKHRRVYELPLVILIKILVGWPKHAPAISPQERDPVNIVQEAGWDPTAGLDRCGKSRDPIDSRTPNRPARNESLCRLSYSGRRSKDKSKYQHVTFSQCQRSAECWSKSYSIQWDAVATQAFSRHANKIKSSLWLFLIRLLLLSPFPHF